MASAQRLLVELKASYKGSNNDAHFNVLWAELKNIVDEYIPELQRIAINSVYLIDSKKGRIRVVCTKENQKTWVMYEVEGSVQPGMRWMLGKTWCTQENIQRDVAQSYAIPTGVRVK